MREALSVSKYAANPASQSLARRSTSSYMTISDINVDEALERVRQQLKEDRTVSPSLRAAIDVLMLLVKLMADRLATSSRNSSKPPSQDMKARHWCPSMIPTRSSSRACRLTRHWSNSLRVRCPCSCDETSGVRQRELNSYNKRSIKLQCR